MYEELFVSEADNSREFKLSDYYKIEINDANIKKFDYPGLKHLRTGNEYKGTIFHVKFRHGGLPIGRVVAFVNVNTTTGMIQALEVSPDFRNKGFGKQLLEYAEKELGAKHLTVRDTNVVARKMYTNSGWKETGKSGKMISMSKTTESVDIESTRPSHEEMTMMEVKYNDKDKYHLNQYVSEHGCYPEFMIDTTMEASLPPVIHTDKLDLRGMTFIHAAHDPHEQPTENSCLYMDGKKYRVRVETLIYNKEGKILGAKKNKLNNFHATYKIPGGSAEPGKTLEQQAIAESQEEVRANVKDIKYSGIWYTNDFVEDDDRALGADRVSWLTKVGLKYDGFLTVVFVGKYAGKFTGRVKKVDQVDWIKDVKFYDPKELDLTEPHKMALRHIWFNQNRLSK